MAKYCGHVDTPWEAVLAFDYMARFDNAAEWDPGVRSARSVHGDELIVGTAFDLEVAIGSRTSTFRYEVVELDPPRKVVLRAQTGLFTSVDTIEVIDRGDDGSRVVYDADLRLRGPLGVFDQMLEVGFRKIGDKALAGLRAHLHEAGVSA